MEKLLVIKYGGNAMTDENLQSEIIKNIARFPDAGYRVILVHGGGPFIRQALEEAGIPTEFVNGQRVTSKHAMSYVEMALKGKVNTRLVSLVNSMGRKAVGLSGKDGKTVIAKKRFEEKMIEGKKVKVDLGQVGDVARVHPQFFHLLLEHNYIPVITCIAADEEGNDFNINADIFSGHIAGEMKASEFIILTDIDGLLRDINDESSLIGELTLDEIPELINNGTIKSGMLPKIEACMLALKKGAKSVRIINGTKPIQLNSIMNKKKTGTIIKV